MWDYNSLFISFLLICWLKSLSAKVRERPQKSVETRSWTFADKTVLESPQKSTTLSRTFCCPRTSANVRVSLWKPDRGLSRTFADKNRRRVKIWLNAYPRTLGSKIGNKFGNKFWKLLVIPRKSAKVCGRIIRGLSRTYADSKKSVRVSRTFADYQG